MTLWVVSSPLSRVGGTGGGGGEALASRLARASGRGVGGEGAVGAES